MSSTTISWRKLALGPQPVAVELAAVEALLTGLAAGAPPSLRWYGYSAPALVLGSGQKIAEVDLQMFGATTLHRRRSGGTAVLFESGLLMQDIALPNSHPLYSPDVTASYRWLGELWVAALADLGINAELLGIAEARSDSADLDPLLRRVCFGGRSPYEVLSAGRKLVGFSQVRRRAGVVLQVALYSSFSAERLAGLLALSPAERSALIDGLHHRVVDLAALATPPPTHEAIIGAFERQLRLRHAVELVDGEWSDSERSILSLVQRSYASLATNADPPAS
jgi:lipoate-protein ligase A